MDASSRRPPMALIYAVTVTGITVNSLVSPAVPEVLRALGAPRSLAGVLVASATFPGIVLAPAIGVLADRYGRREVLVPCLVVFGLAGGLGAVAPSFWLLVAARLLQGMGSAGLINLAVVLIGDHWTGEERARRIGRNAAVLTVSIVLFPPLGGLLTDAAGWRAPFAVYLVSLVTAVWARRLPPSGARQGGLREQVGAAMPFLRTPAMAGVVGAGFVVFVLVFGLLLTVLPLHLEGRFGLGPAARGLLQALPSVTATAGSLGLPLLRSRLGRRVPLVAGPVLFALGFAAMAGAGGLPLLAAGLLAAGLGEGVLIPSLQDLATGIAPTSSRATVVAVWVGSARAGQTVGPLVAAAGLEALGAERTFGVGAAVAALTALAAAGGARRLDQRPEMTVPYA